MGGFDNCEACPHSGLGGGRMEDFSKFNLVGRAPAFLCVLRLIEKFSACDATVLIHGETGTGKELAARAIHYLGAQEI